ncbi:PhnD/SsuA/transferrin family substrate-binding protein [Pikeienuella piscinae]|uniref:PhnD/SsuA/transferrin family substrate-binding protein n=1 Tax=Pikeienuella piscinae TaxID=2748098 RepID=A0A7M3T5A3_9RHOB|nr:PhnD/SsuA/transferrin family substrate-binding protein [Pikeienuella piscinae]QIE57184.1 PhnD/SsuA/transferrin family substrate-binding protein [Pikeienuella piscinae]
MYDWPEVRAATDTLWSLIRERLRAAAFPAPEVLSRPDNLWLHWREPALLLSQTCGLPYAAQLAGAVSLVGAPSYDLPGCPPGFYRSEILVRADDPVADVDALKGGRFARNGRESQSGHAAFAAAFGPPEAYFSEIVEAGAHRASIRAVAEGRADAASVDAVSWRLARAHEPASARLRVLASTPPTPGLPLITGKRSSSEVQEIAKAVDAAIAELPDACRATLFLNGFEYLAPADYAPLAAGWPSTAEA